MIQTTIEELIAGGAKPEEETIRFKITHKTTYEEREVLWVANSPGFVLADWAMGGEMKFRAGTGQGIGIAKEWVITKSELSKLKKRTE